MYRFYATVHWRPATVVHGEEVQVGGLKLFALTVDPAALVDTFPVSFEQAAERMQALPRMLLEPDGSFVWVDACGCWQLDGSLVDDGKHVRHMEVGGTCLPRALDDLLRVVDWPSSPLMFQLIRYGVFLAEEEFRRVACSACCAARQN
jgi:hypothetical protein